LFNQLFYFNLTRKYVTLVGALFDDIFIPRFIEGPSLTELVKVPITYAPKDKMMARVLEDPEIARKAGVVLPMISFERGAMNYDGSRKLSTLNRASIGLTNSPSSMNFQYVPVPYNIDFKVYVYTKSVEDESKIIEQILPFFTPDWTTTVKLIPEMNVTMDIPVILNKINYSDNYDDKYPQRRAIVSSIDLTVKGYFYGPIKTDPIIQFANMHFYTPMNIKDLKNAVGNSALQEYMNISPGQNSNGQPVYYWGGTSTNTGSIPANTIWANSDYGYVTTISSSTLAPVYYLLDANGNILSTSSGEFLIWE
jgi:hypothetical protein